LAAQQAWFGALVAHAPDAIVVCTTDLTVSFGNPAWDSMLASAGAIDLRGLLTTATHPDDADEAARFGGAVLASPSTPVSSDLRLRASGDWRWFRTIATNLIDNPDISGIVINMRDITDRKRATLLQQALADFILVAPSVTNPDSLIASAVTMACAALDIGPAQLRQLTYCWPMANAAGKRDPMSAVLAAPESATRPPSNPADDHYLQSMCQLLTSAMDRMKAEAELRHHALHDALTGLANRALLDERLVESLEHATTIGASVAVFLLDLDNFKLINDSLGHGFGDQILRETGARLIRSVRAQDTVARFGGDEFVVIAVVDDAEEAMDLARRMQSGLDKPVHANDQDYFVTASIGVSLSGPDAFSPDILLRSSDVAMYAAKRQGRGCVAVFADAMHADSSRRLDVQRRLRPAIEKSEISVHYQPVLELRTNRIIGVEALARWNDPELGPVSPVEFIGIAEESGLILSLGRQLMEQAVRDVSSLLHRLPGVELSLAVNVSAKELIVPGFTDTLRSILTTSGYDPANLVVELTETALVSDPFLALQSLTDLRRHGVKIAIDDFGTGFSSLQTVRDYPIDFLKIDSSFTRGIDLKQNSAIVAGIISLANALGAKAVAEGVETAPQLQALRRLQCEHAQGFYWSPALPLEQLHTWIQRSNRRAERTRIFR
jgi:diguanylate cyclase (GGDEF)-like protein/PAS domain S-box-containing protein